MSHRHFCDFAGHFWECEGTALRPLAGDTEPSVCMCETCHVPMEQGDHSGCMVELLACPEHRDEQERLMAEMSAEIDAQSDEEEAALAHCECGCADAAPENVVAWCMWCDHVYGDYSAENEDQHFAHHCPNAPQALRESARKRQDGR